MIRVIFRTCDKVESIHGLARPFGLDKKSLIKVCFKSLVDSLEWSHEKSQIIVLGDELSMEMVEFFQEYEQVALRNEKLGNDESLRTMFKITESFDDEDIVYFVEDDYLHFKYSFGQCFKWLNALPDVAVHPTDYPAAYQQDRVIPSLILLGESNHWRSVNTSTFTFMLKVKTLRKHMQHFVESCEGANDAKLSNLFGWQMEPKVFLFSPIPGLATHMHEGTMSPYMPWDKIMEEYK